MGLSTAVENARKVTFNELGFNCYLNTLIAQKIDHVSDESLLKNILIKSRNKQPSAWMTYHCGKLTESKK